MTTTKTNPNVKAATCDAAEIKKALRLIAGDSVTELRALGATIGNDRFPATYSGYFDEPNKLAKAVESLRWYKGVYIIPNAVNPSLLARCKNRIQRADKGSSTQDTDILRRHWLLVDCDPVRPTGISTSDEEHNAAIERCQHIWLYTHNEGWPDPIMADSGNGGHLLYHTDLPTDDGGLVQRCLSAMAQRFNDEVVKVDESVYNPARIWKLYGTLARKGDHTVERPHRLARILDAERIEVVPTRLLEKLAAEVTAPETPKRHERNGHGQAFDVQVFLDRLHLDVDGPRSWNGGRLWVLRSNPLCVHPDCHVEQHASGAISAGCFHNSCSWTWVDLRARYEPKYQSSEWSQFKANNKADANTPSPHPSIVSLADVEPQAVDWLWPGRVAIGKLTLLAGDPGLGKSFLTLDMAARVSRGAAWPDDSSAKQTPGGVVLLSAEDDLADTIRPRLDAHLADVTRIVALQSITFGDSLGDTCRGVDLTKDLPAVEASIDAVESCRLVVIDPISAFLGETDSHKNAEVRGVLARLADMAGRNRVAVVAVTHLRKSEGSAIYKTMGSLAFVAAARAAWAVCKDPTEPRKRLVLPLKNNLAPDIAGLAYQIEEPLGGGSPIVSWYADSVAISVDEAMAKPRKQPGPDATVVGEACEWLREKLTDGPKRAAEIYDVGINGEGYGKKTIQRAKKMLNVVAYHKENPGPWLWGLPEAGGQRAP